MKKRITALLLAVVSILSMLTAPASAAAPDTIKMDDCAYSGTKYDSPALGECYMHLMRRLYEKTNYRIASGRATKRQPMAGNT